MDPIIIAGIAAIALLLAAAPLAFSRTRRAVPEGKALVIHKNGETRVSFEDTRAWPLVHRTELINIGLRRIDVVCVGKSSLSCRDSLRADVEASFYLQINPTAEDVLKVYKSIGATRAGDPTEVAALFEPKCREAMATVFSHMDLAEITGNRDDVRDQILQVIGQDLSGFRLEDMAISRIEMTPLEFLDPQNVFDAKGIHKLTELTTHETFRTHQLKLEQDKRIAALDQEAERMKLHMEREIAEARIQMEHDIEVVKLNKNSTLELIKFQEDRKVDAAHRQRTEEKRAHIIEMKRSLELPEIKLED